MRVFLTPLVVMRIGIITTHTSLNVGAVLQAFSSQKLLESMGHDVEFIDYHRPHRKPLRYYLSKNPLLILYSLMDSYNRWKYLRRGDFNKVLNVGSKVYKTIDDLGSDPPDYDVYYAGSDQIWTISSSQKIDRCFYLDFGPPAVKRVAYAASLGQGIVPEFLKVEMKNLLLNFDHISIREDSGVKVVQEILGDHKKIFQELTRRCT